jgi:hypothetical protein
VGIIAADEGLCTLASRMPLDQQQDPVRLALTVGFSVAQSTVRTVKPPCPLSQGK